MASQTFFKLTPGPVLSAFLITGLSMAMMLQALSCALDGSGQCFQVPVPIVAVGIVALWPWVLTVRLFGDNMILGMGLGFLLSFAWVFLIICTGRWGIGKWWRKGVENQNSI